MATVRGVAFLAVFYGSMAVCGVLFFIPAAVSARLARRLARAWVVFIFAALRLICGVRREIRGAAPTGRVIVAAKHQSMLDVFMIVHALPEGRFVMKQELARVPVFGWYSMRMGAVPVDRAGGRAALQAMVARVTAAASGQIVIYPQGTRVAPGARAPYRGGVYALYEASGLPCVPCAVNTGLRWPRGPAVVPGLAVVEFLAAIPPGLPRGAFMARLEAAVERATDALARETR